MGLDLILISRNVHNCARISQESYFQLQDQHFTSRCWESSIPTVLLFLLKFHSKPQTLLHHLMLIELHLGDMPSAMWLFQENRNIHFAITVTARVHMIQRETFFPVILYFISSISPFYFTSKIAAQISGGAMCVRKAFYLLSVPSICTSHYAPDVPGKWNDLQKGASGNSLGIM